MVSYVSRGSETGVAVDVLVVGAGPAGSAAATELSRAGFDVLLIDRRCFPRPKPCGEYYNPACVRLLRRLGVLASIDAEGAVAVPRLQLRYGGECVLSVSFADLGTEVEPARTLPRERFDAVLLDAARQSGVRVWEQTLAREPWLECDRVVGAVVRHNGREFPVRAGVTLAADGLRSRFARQLGLAVESRRRKFGVTGRYRSGEPGPELVMHPGEDGCCGLALRDGEAHFGLVVDGARVRELGGNPAAFLHRTLGEYPDLACRVHGDPEIVNTVGPLTWRTRRQAVAGCLLLGDAAGFYDPFTGQGVTFALLTAALASEVTAAALRDGDVSARRLREYERRRRRLLAEKYGVQVLIQAALARPWLRDRVLRRLQQKPDLARTLVSVISDIAPASRVCNPLFMARLFLSR